MVGESHQAEAAITMEITENDHESQFVESNGEALRELLRPPLDIPSFDKPRSIPQSAHVEPKDAKRITLLSAYIFAGTVLAFVLWMWNKKVHRARRIRRKHILEP